MTRQVDQEIIEATDELKEDVQLTHDIVTGDENTVIEVSPGNRVRSPKKMIEDTYAETQIEIEERFGSLETAVNTATDEATKAEHSNQQSQVNATAAATSASQSATSEANAQNSEAKAKASETAAANSKTHAANSATAAGQSASSASASEDNAKSSASASGTSAANALSSETKAKTSETAAATSETNAASSASASADSATAAATSERNASVSETAAATSETNAAKSEQVANTSEVNALASEQAAKASETAAGVSASQAAASEANAASSETSASGSAGIATSQADRAKSEADRAATAADSVPDDVLRQANNLSDLPDKAVSRSNLQVYSKSETDNKIDDKETTTAIWVGEIRRFSFDTPPAGFFAIDGSTIPNGRNDFSELANCGSRFITVSGNDLILEDFLDFGRGKGSSGRSIGSFEGDAIRDIEGTIEIASDIHFPTRNGSGAMYSLRTSGAERHGSGAANRTNGIGFRASRVVPTASENRPKSRTELVCIYHGVI